MKRATLLFGLCVLFGVLAGCGGSSTSTPPPPPPPPPPPLPQGTELLYEGDNVGTIHGYGVDPSSGSFTTLSSVAVSSQGPAGDVGLVADAGSQVLYATSAGVGGPNVASFAVDQQYGTISSLSTQTLPVPPRKVTAYGNSLFVIPDPSANSANVFVFNISVNGALSLLPNQPITLPGVPQDLAVDPSGAWLFITFQGASGGEIAILSLKSSPISVTASFSTGGDSPKDIVVTPDDKFVIVANEATNDVSVLSLDASTGALISISGSPFAGANQPGPIVVDPSGQFVFVGDTGGDTLSAFTLGTAGDLASIAGTPIQLGNGAHPSSMAVDPNGKFIFISTALKEISGFTLDQSTGALTAISGFPFSAGQETRDLVVMPHAAGKR
jgi:6-phosphogluconolactonase (cycloisomerase 2 family)